MDNSAGLHNRGARMVNALIMTMAASFAMTFVVAVAMMAFDLDAYISGIVISSLLFIAVSAGLGLLGVALYG